MLLRMMRGRRTGGPSVVARVLAVLVVAGMVALAAPMLAAPAVAVVRWLAGVL
jgi:hypothetical protein